MMAAFWMILISCFTFACISDLLTCTVVNFTWYIGGAAAVILFCTAGNFSLPLCGDILLFAGLQLLLFSRFYGLADCYAFIVCGITLASQGLRLKSFLVQMLLAFVMLAVVQGIRRNISDTGNLKTPVPFLPYITLALYGTLWYYNC